MDELGICLEVARPKYPDGGRFQIGRMEETTMGDRKNITVSLPESVVQEIEEVSTYMGGVPVATLIRNRILQWFESPEWASLYRRACRDRILKQELLNEGMSAEAAERVSRKVFGRD